MIFLRSIERLGDVEVGSAFPFALPPLRGFRKLEITSPITFFSGDNGTGKSTLLEAIGLRAKLRCAAGQPLEYDPALVALHPLARSLRLSWAPPTKSGFFLRVEDFFVHAREQRKRSEPLSSVTVHVEADAQVITAGRGTTLLREADEFAGLSAGESFLRFVKEHCQPGGLHLIDEPEAALSPQRQLELMSFLKSAVDDNAQFIIATHSPILLAHPGAQILGFDQATIAPIRYDELPEVKLTRDFLRDPEQYLRAL